MLRMYAFYYCYYVLLRCRFLLLQKLLAQACEIFTDVTTDMNLMRTLQSCGTSSSGRRDPDDVPGSEASFLLNPTVHFVMRQH